MELNDTTFEFSLEEQGLVTYIKTSGIKYNIGQISNDVTKSLLLVNHPDIARKIISAALGLHTQGIDTSVKYEGLKKDENNVICMSYDIEKQLYESIKQCASQDDDNIVRFLLDYCKIGRMRQELTIDYAKKLTDLSGIQSLMFKDVIAMGLRPCKIVFNASSGVTIYPAKEPEIDEFEDSRIVLYDDLYNIQNMCMNYTKNLIEAPVGILDYIAMQEPVYAMEADLSKETSEPEKYIFVNIKNMYKDIVGGMRKKDDDEEELDEYGMPNEEKGDPNFKDNMDRLSNMLRLATPNMTPEERARKIKACSRRGDDAENENKFYLHVCKEEYLLWLLSLNLQSVDYVGEILFDETKTLNVGDKVNFIDGQEASGKDIYIEYPYTGELTVFKKDDTLFAGKLLKDSISVPETNGNIMVKIDQNLVHKMGTNYVFDLCNDRMHNRVKIVPFFDNRGKKSYFLLLRNKENNIVKVPIFLPNDLDSLVNTIFEVTEVSIKKVTGNNGLPYDVIYVSLDKYENLES